MIDLHGDGKLGDGIFKHERIFKLALFVYIRELGEFLVGEVALAVVQLGLGIRGEGDLDATEVAVLGGVGGVVANEVIVGNGFLRVDDAAVEVVVVEEGFAAGVAGQGVERVLRLLEVAGVSLCGGSGVDAGVAGGSLSRIAEGG